MTLTFRRMRNKKQVKRDFYIKFCEKSEIKPSTQNDKDKALTNSDLFVPLCENSYFPGSFSPLLQFKGDISS